MDGHSGADDDQTICMFIKDTTDLVRASKILSREKVVGVDLESDSMFHYKEKVCLVQISVPGLNILIDTLSIRDLSPLSSIFSERNIRKVFHGSDYDIRSLFRDFKIEINSLFDTQIAARFLGISQTGLSSVLQSRFGIRVEKKYQKSDWSRRPLSMDMLQYAVQDTYYLIPLSRMFEDELREKGRLSWFEEECELQSRVRFSPPEDEPLYLRFKGASKLAPRNLAILDEILKWREELALKKNIPPFKVLGNQQILEIVNTKPMNMDGFETLSAKQVKSIGKSLLQRIHAAMGMHEDELPEFSRERRHKQSAATVKKINALRKWREAYGEKTGLDPSLLCPNSLIQSISLMDKCSIEVLKEMGEIRKWRIELFGNEICGLLSGMSQAQK